jgi:hypothetical protein
LRPDECYRGYDIQSYCLQTLLLAVISIGIKTRLLSIQIMSLS